MPSLDKAVGKALEAGDVGPIIKAIDALGPGQRTSAFNHAIRNLWDRYDREMAMPLIKELAERHGDALIAQYWMKQSLEVEPQIARAVLTREFLEQHFKPDLAARCGPVG